MAKNLQAKLPPSDTIRLFDINTDAMEKLVREMKSSQAGGATVEMAPSAHDAARDAVSSPYQKHTAPAPSIPFCMMRNLFVTQSMI